MLKERGQSFLELLIAFLFLGTLAVLIYNFIATFIFPDLPEIKLPIGY